MLLAACDVERRLADHLSTTRRTYNNLRRPPCEAMIGPFQIMSPFTVLECDDLSSLSFPVEAKSPGTKRHTRASSARKKWNSASVLAAQERHTVAWNPRTEAESNGPESNGRVTAPDLMFCGKGSDVGQDRDSHPVLLDAFLCLVAVGPSWALAVLALFVPFAVLGRWVSST